MEEKISHRRTNIRQIYTSEPAFAYMVTSLKDGKLLAKPSTHPSNTTDSSRFGSGVVSRSLMHDVLFMRKRGATPSCPRGILFCVFRDPKYARDCSLQPCNYRRPRSVVRGFP